MASYASSIGDLRYEATVLRDVQSGEVIHDLVGMDSYYFNTIR